MRMAWALGLMVAAGICAAEENVRPEPDVTIYVTGAGVVDPGTMAFAKSIVNRLFGDIGVGLAWPVERMPEETPRVVLRIGLVTGPAPSRFSPEALAFSCPYEGGCEQITVFWDRVRRHKRRLVAPLLAHVIAHEIGHVLEAAARHAAEGVMKARWTADDYDSMIFKPLPFTREHAELVHDGLERLRRLALTGRFR